MSFNSYLQHEANYPTPHGTVEVYSDVPQIPSEVQFPRNLTAEQVMAQADIDLREMKDRGIENVAAFYASKEDDVRKTYKRFYFAKWGQQRILTSSTMPSKAEVLEALGEYRSANGMAPPRPSSRNENAAKFDELVGKLVKSTGA